MILLNILTILIVPLSKAKAQVISDGMFDSFSPNTIVEIQNGNFYTNANFKDYNNNQKYLFISAGEGEIIFNFAYWSTNTNASYLKSVEVIRYDDYVFECDIGNQLQWFDNNTGRYFISAKCPVNIPNGQSLKQIRFWRYGNTGNINISMGQQMTMVKNGEAQDIIANQQSIVQQQIQNNNTNTQAIINATNNQTNEIKEELHDKWLQDQENFEEFMNSDISNQTKQQPNQDEYDNVEEKEQDVYDNLDDIDIDTLIDMNVDINTNNWIWNTITTLLNTNTRVFSMVIAVLSLGLSKFILGR